ncbi:MAG: hypothetical protein JW829_15740 [Pirellulales bacterium]|nr:hypothetical protein [Pirellulales bacterium]
MRHRLHNTHDQPGQDSFLDIVANIVGVLIILVTVVGVRAAHAPPIAAEKDIEPDGNGMSAANGLDPENRHALVAKELMAARTRVASLRHEVSQTAQQILRAEHEIQKQDAQRTHLQSAITLIETELDKRRETLSAAQREKLDMQRQIAEARSHLEKLAREQCSLEMASESVETIVNMPTPLAQTARGDEVHIRLANGRVSIVPIDSLVALFEQDVQTKLWKLKNHDELIETVGPVGGYRLRYRMAKQAYMVPASGGVQCQTAVQLDQWEVLPVAEDLGIPAEQALIAGSDLRQALLGRAPDKTSVTIWTYPDSFSQFRMLKKALFELGYSTAARPIPAGVRIGGSPRGTKSSVE